MVNVIVIADYALLPIEEFEHWKTTWLPGFSLSVLLTSLIALEYIHVFLRI